MACFTQTQGHTTSLCVLQESVSTCLPGPCPSHRSSLAHSHNTLSVTTLTLGNTRKTTSIFIPRVSFAYSSVLTKGLPYIIILGLDELPHNSSEKVFQQCQLLNPPLLGPPFPTSSCHTSNHCLRSAQQITPPMTSHRPDSLRRDTGPRTIPFSLKAYSMHIQLTTKS